MALSTGFMATCVLLCLRLGQIIHHHHHNYHNSIQHGQDLSCLWYFVVCQYLDISFLLLIYSLL